MSAPSYDPFATESHSNPYPHYAELREKAPVYRLDGPGHYFVSRYEDVVEVLTHPEVFSSRAMSRMMMAGMSGGIQNIDASQGLDPGTADAIQQMAEIPGFNPIEMMNTPSIIASDPPNHARLRGILNRAFTPRRIASLENRVREIASDALDRMLVEEQFDFVSGFTVPLPVTVIAELLGVDHDRLDDFKRWSDTLISSATGSQSDDNTAAMLKTFREYSEYFVEHIERRRRDPKDDLISALVGAEEGEVALSPAETLRFTVLLLVAGNETTTNLMGNTMVSLLGEPEQFARVQANPGLVPNLVEEGLRHDGPVHMVFRETVQDAEIAGTKIPEGSLVLPILASANRDRSQFSDPDRFDIDRDTKGHVALGLGVHYCLGSSLARLEARVGFEELFKRVRELQFDTDAVEYVDSFMVRGPKRLPLTARSV